MHEGHRKRILERVRNFPESLGDHELLEVLLFNVIPRQNTNPLAHRLLTAFGSLEGVLKADVSLLMAVDGVGESTAAYLACISELFRRLPQSEPVTLSSSYNAHDFKEYLSKKFYHTSYEHLEIYCLDGRGSIRFTKVFTDLDPKSATVSPDQIMYVLATQKPYAIVVAHNHPNGQNFPSAADNDFTKKLQLICSFSNIHFYDHVILTPDGNTFSYYLEGYMSKICEAITVDQLVKGAKLS